jgi:hypothetical protein
VTLSLCLHNQVWHRMSEGFKATIQYHDALIANFDEVFSARRLTLSMRISASGVIMC